MQLLKGVFVLGLVLQPSVFSESAFQCYVEVLNNGSVAYKLNNTIPNDWTISWTKNDTVIVSEEGDMHKDYVVDSVENGYILKECYTSIMCILESPLDGVSKKIPCSDPCKPSHIRTSDGRISSFAIIIIMVILFTVLLALIGFFVYTYCKRSRHSTDAEMQCPTMLSQDQNQDQNHTDH
ncbi:hypothetical protein QTP70_033537 [Hemibagrus guttatus]|uniref:Uncharacterized protein n=1 Tax=Hemibagrus guttatus TaxID=175788 RepID=A0AAE0RFV4_9TELE|nr:hypothetical protein QTP70_033537 [Hemibagrus guttatus]